MRLNRESIESSDDFTVEEKKYLLEKFFPETEPAPWQKELRKGWDNSKRWHQYLDSKYLEPMGEPFRYTHNWLLETAQRKRPLMSGKNVTDFTGWVYSLYYPKNRAEQLTIGKYIERELVRRYVDTPRNRGWELIYEGIRRKNRSYKTISSLTVGEKPMRGAPDFVFQDNASGRVVIVEIKASNREIPSDSWPNLRAQLWAYSQIDDWRNAPEIILIAEVWGFTADKIVLRGTHRWTHNDQDFNYRNLQLFKLYGGMDEKSIQLENLLNCNLE